MVFKDLMNATDFQKSLFIMVAGIIGVFLVLIIFYILIKVITRLFPEEKNK